MSPHIILIGPPGAGKTSVAKALSKRIGKRFVDTDALVEKKSGKKISEIFLEEGEPRFRELEREAVIEALAGDEEIVSLGGGAILDESIRKEIATSGQVIFLDVSISNAAPRVGFNRERPLLVGNPRAQWLSLMEKRRPLYEQLATTTISTDNKKPEDVVTEILEKVRI